MQFDAHVQTFACETGPEDLPYLVRFELVGSTAKKGRVDHPHEILLYSSIDMTTFEGHLVMLHTVSARLLLNARHDISAPHCP